MSDLAQAPAGPAQAPDTVLSARDLKVHLPVRQGFQTRPLKAVDGVTFDLKAGECLGLVGESGCGKSTLAQAVMGLLPATSSRIDLAAAGTSRKSRARAIQMVFQDPFSALNPRMTVRQTLDGPLRLHGLCPADQIETRAARLLERVGIDAGAMDRYPHAFSGGQRQRLCIARALVAEPRILICDEPVSALVMISHALGVIEHLSDRIAVMYLGRFVETGHWNDVMTRPAHPHTRALLDYMPAARLCLPPALPDRRRPLPQRGRPGFHSAWQGSRRPVPFRTTPG